MLSATPETQPEKLSLDKFERHWQVVVNEIHCHEPSGFENQEFVGGGKDCYKVVDIHLTLTILPTGNICIRTVLAEASSGSGTFFLSLLNSQGMFLSILSVSSQAMQIKWQFEFLQFSRLSGSWLLVSALPRPQGLDQPWE